AVSYSELIGKIRAFAAQLQVLDVRPGARIGLCFPNSISYVALTYALWRLDAIVVPIPIECTEEELTAIAEKMELGGILSQKPRDGSLPLQADCYFTKLSP